jgi:RNA polymerase sigma-70 factor, ECF subfamily
MPLGSTSKRRRPDSAELSTWFRRACKREEGALQQLLALYRPLLTKVARQQVRGALRAKIGASDIVQSTIWKATQGFPAHRFSERKRFLAWLLSILKHEAADVRRRFQDAEKRNIGRERSLFSPDTMDLLSRVSASLSAADAVVSPQGHTVEDLLAGLGRLPPHYQLVLRLRYYEKLPFEAIGRRLERSADAARVLQNRALAKLRSELDRMADRGSRPPASGAGRIGPGDSV